MVTTNSVSTTRTYSRIDLICTQVKITLRRTICSISASSLDAIIKGVKNHWIKKISIYGIDSDGLCRGQISLEIDWNEHDKQISMGITQITLDETYDKDGGSVEVDEITKLFNDFVRNKHLRTEWTVSYSSQVDIDYVDRELGFSTVKPLKWVEGERLSTGHIILGIKEVNVGLYLVD